jgi:hypothetical protein
MSYIAPAFYYYHAAREAQNATFQPASIVGSTFSLFDDRQGEVVASDQTSGNVFITVDRELTPEADAVDTLIISGHNFAGLNIQVFAIPGGVPMYPSTPVAEANGVPIIIPLTPELTSSNSEVQLGIINVSVEPELTELTFTTEHALSRGPEPNWQHPWARTQRQFLSEGGVSSTWVTGAARKRFRMTWRHLVGADRQIFLDMREQTAQWSEPFWFRPPDTTYPTALYELDRDSDWVQDFDSPLDSGTSDAITMPLIEVLG